MVAKVLRGLTFVLSVSFWSTGVLGALEDINEIQSRDVPTPGQPVSGGFATYFSQNGLAGACGQVHADSALIAAMDIAIFSNSLCGQLVRITNTQNQKNVTVAIADECSTCQNAESIDLSLGAFEAIADLEQGTVPIMWTLL
ncbi:hypothetical protein PILCRDRAFT_530144 [Piloderma croceum F 1598]|uniref:RlpA-like protein double-psi beta-barrel domain-containing protein n=1 Tax=Piloderma croceum (strain F 1598) TaxID=765440 RepID=A0A0C3B284_PILCF|nr:hypothetical protein PILCRDRAFT_530144 [Piloderma croceum F 1598]